MGMTIIEKILARKSGAATSRAGRPRGRRCRSRRDDRSQLRAGVVARGAEGARPRQGRRRVRPRRAGLEPRGGGDARARPRVRAALRHQAGARCRAGPGDQPCRRRRERLRAARHRDGLLRLAYLQRRGAELRRARPRRPRPALCADHRARPGSGSARPCATISTAASRRAYRRRTCSSTSPAPMATTPTRMSSSAARPCPICRSTRAAP